MEPGKGPTTQATRGLVEVPGIRDPDTVALKPKFVRRITAPLKGRADTWVPPAGLMIENSKAGLGQNLWDYAADTRDLGPKPPPPRGPWFELPEHRDPEKVALKPKHVRQVTKNLRGPVDQWRPPAGLYVENSKAGLNMNMWDLLQQAHAGGGPAYVPPGGRAAAPPTPKGNAAPASARATTEDAVLIA